MADFTTSKVDGNTVDASEWNQLADLDNAVTSSGQTPSTGNLNQLGIAMAINASGADFYSDSGTANAYVLTAIGTLKSPHAYFDGMRARFRPDNANTGASTVNVATLGVKSIKRPDGTTAASAGDIPANADVELRYDLANGVFVLSGASVQPTIQKFTSGSGTYTTPSGVRYIKVKQVGAGGGGAGSGGSGGTGGTGGNTTFGTTLLVANGGVGGVVNGNIGGAGGTASLGTGPIGTALIGGYGNCGVSSSAVGTFAVGGMGGTSQFGGAGSGGNGNGGGVGGSAVINTGAGGGGAGGTSTTTFAGAGGGAGGYIDAIIANPSATYAYSVGSAGVGGSAGASGFVGGSGSTGYIEVTEYYH